MMPTLEKKSTKCAKRKVKPHTNLVLSDSNAIVGFIKENWDNGTIDKYESAYVLYLDYGGKVIEWELFNTGTINYVTVPINTLMRKAVSLNAYGIVFAHNHPGGNTSPSERDLKTTELIYKSCKVLDIQFIDHIIVTVQGKPYSFFQRGDLKKYDDNYKLSEDLFIPGTFANTAYNVVSKYCESAKQSGAVSYLAREATERLNKVYIKFYDPIV